MTDWEKKLHESASTYQRVAMPFLPQPLKVKISKPMISYQNGGCHACGNPMYPEVLYNLEIGMHGRIFAVCNNSQCYVKAHEKVLRELLEKNFNGLQTYSPE